MIAALLLAAAPALTFTADRIAADNVTRSAVASGHVHAVHGPVTVRGDYMERDAAGVLLFRDPTYATTCSNEVGHTHWNVTGEIKYDAKSHVLLKNMWLSFYEVPVLWLPYFWYPLDTKCGFSWMPGYTDRWGGYLLTKYSYHVLGDAEHQDNTWWLTGATRFDLRYQNGVALGEDLRWNLGDFGKGRFKVYYAWDEDAGDRYGDPSVSRRHWRWYNWNSDVDRDRYGFDLSHRWEVTERDTLRAAGTYYSDSRFRHDFVRRSLFNIKNQFSGYETPAVAWEHLENFLAFGIEAGGRLNDFYTATERLPEAYFDVNPIPVFGLPVNYESENRLGYLRRRPAVFAAGSDSVYGRAPGVWADYAATRLDTYHRLTAPFRFLGDVVSAVPRIGYHGTFWDQAGYTHTDGFSGAGKTGREMYRSIAEGGATFAARGTAWINDEWRHMIEPYLDVVAQEASYSGARGGARPYVFDSIDASMSWEDQFAGRSRNLPYSYYGITPGVRNAWSLLTENGSLRNVVDVDIYAAVQFNTADWSEPDDASMSARHRLAHPGSPNYGKHAGFISPGARLRWTPADDIAFFARAEYDSDNNRLAFADVTWMQKVSKDFSFHFTYRLRDHRLWDFSSAPYDPSEMEEDAFNMAKYHQVEFGLTQQPLDWLAWSPFVRWDIRDGDLDSVGGWIDYLTDCLGFRLIVEYENDYTRIDGSRTRDDWNVGFYVYLRAFGSEGPFDFFH